MGDLAKQQQLDQNPNESSSTSSAAKKYTTQETTETFKREVSVASASNVGVTGDQSRANSSMDSAQSRPGTSLLSRTGSTTDMMRKNFENF